MMEYHHWKYFSMVGVVTGSVRLDCRSHLDQTWTPANGGCVEIDLNLLFPSRSFT